MTTDCPHCGQDLRLTADTVKWCKDAVVFLETFLARSEHEGWGSSKPLRELLGRAPSL